MASKDVSQQCDTHGVTARRILLKRAAASTVIRAGARFGRP
jgi:hypothetical protein